MGRASADECRRISQTFVSFSISSLHTLLILPQLSVYCETIQLCRPHRLVSERGIADFVETIVADTLIVLTNEHRAHPFAGQSSSSDFEAIMASKALTTEQTETATDALWRTVGFISFTPSCRCASAEHRMPTTARSTNCACIT